MTDAYDIGSDGASVGASGRPLTREPYQGPRIRNRRTGEVRYWVGDRYVAQTSQERLTPQERTRLSELQEDAGRYARMLPDLNRFEELNREVPTGALSHRFGLWAQDMPRILSIDSNGPGDNGDTSVMIDEMRSITDRLTPSQRAPGSGASSNLDVTMFRSGLPNIGRTGDANSDIISGFRRQARDAQDLAEFMEWYWPRTGSLTGAQEQFEAYRQARRRDPDLTWRQHFGAEVAAGGNGARETWVRDPRSGRLMRQR